MSSWAIEAKLKNAGQGLALGHAARERRCDIAEIKLLSPRAAKGD
jgi:hypothetical protein